MGRRREGKEGWGIGSQRFRRVRETGAGRRQGARAAHQRVPPEDGRGRAHRVRGLRTLRRRRHLIADLQRVRAQGYHHHASDEKVEAPRRHRGHRVLHGG